MSDTLYLLKHLESSKIATEQKIAKCILENPARIISMNITELAGKAGTSTSAIVRLYKRLEFKRFQEFKTSIAKEIYTKQFASRQHKRTSLQYDPSSSSIDIVANILDVCSEAIQNIDKLINRENIDIIVDKIRNARAILIAGAGASGIVGYDLHHKLCRLGYLSLFTENEDLQTMAACTLSNKDVVIAISYSGERKHIINTIKEAKKNHAYIIVITRYKLSTIVKLADITLYVPNTESIYREGATISRLCQLILVDIIHSTLIAKDFDRSVDLLNRTWFSIDQQVSE
jgi:DNA-binding MurR/RpiR family transcriptional regulator